MRELFIQHFLRKKSLLRRINKLIRKRDFSAAEAACKVALRRFDDAGHFQAILAYIAEQTGNYESCIAITERIAAAGALSADSYFRVGLSYLALGNIAGATTAFKAAHDSLPGHAPYVKSLLDVLIASADVRLMRQVYSEFSNHQADRTVTKSYAIGLLKYGAPDDLQAFLSEKTGLSVHSLQSVRCWAEAKDQAIQFYGEPERVKIVAPAQLGESGTQAARHYMTVEANAPYVAKLNDATIFSRSSCILSEDGTVLEDNATHAKFGHEVTLVNDPLVVSRNEGAIIIDQTPFTPTTSAGGIFLAGHNSNAFGHWVPDYLSKLRWLSQHRDFQHAPILVDAGMPESHFTYLASVTSNPIVRIPANTALRCKYLLVANPPTFQPSEILLRASKKRLSLRF